MTRNRILFGSIFLLVMLHLELRATTSRKLIASLSRTPTPTFFTDQQSSGASHSAQTQSQTQTRMQTRTRTQTQTQTQPQTLYIGFPMTLTWKFKTNGPVIAQPQTDASNVYCVSKPGVVHAVSQNDGKQIWKSNLGDVMEEAFLLRQNVLYAGTGRGLLFALEDKKGKQLWNQKVDGESFLTMPAADQNNLYFTGKHGTVVSVRQSTGAFVWKFKIKAECNTTPYLQNNLLFVGCEDHFLYALDARAGFLKWRFNASAAINGSPIATNEFVFSGDENGLFYCLRTQDGTEKWKVKVGGAIRGVPMFYYHKEEQEPSEILMSAFDNFLYDFKIKNGNRQWLAGTSSRVYNRMFLDRALIFLAPFGSTVIGIDPHTGRRTGDFGAYSRIRSSPITANDKLFLGLNNGDLVSLTRTPPPPPETEEGETQPAPQPSVQTQEEEAPEAQTAETQTQTSQ